METRKPPVGIQSFKDIRTNNYLYIDKTATFRQESFTSTLERYFSGKKNLFKGLYIYDKENERGEDAWTEYPIISFYLSSREIQESERA